MKQRAKVKTIGYMTARLSACMALALMLVTVPCARAQSDEQSGHSGHAGMQTSSSPRPAPGHSGHAGVQMAGPAPVPTGVAPSAAEEPGTGQMPAGTVQLSPRKQQISGVRTGRVEERRLTRVIRTVALLQPNETRIRRIHTKISGWIERLFVNFTGQLVERDQPIVSIYSPELVSTQVEYLLALKGQRWLNDSPFPEASSGANSLLQATRQRLLFWDITPEQIRKLEKRGEPEKTLVLHSPFKGFVTIKEIYEGMYINPEMDLYTITDLSQIWSYLDIYEYELPLVKMGQEVLLTLSYFPGQTFRGKVTYIYPTLDPQTRTNKIRVEFPNPDYRLKPDMYASAELRVDLGKHLAVPEDAVLDSGTEQIVFQVAGDGHFEPRRVKLGSKAEGFYELLAGLSPGAEVVTSANFLVDSESRLKAAMGAMAGHGGMAQAATQPAMAPVAAKATVEMSTEPSPARRGKNKILVTLRDAKGAPVTGAEVSLVFFMPGMPSMNMPAVRREAKAAEQGNGIYAANVDLESGGTWQVTIAASRGGSAVATKQLELSVGGGM